MNFDLKRLLFQPILFLGLIFLPAQNFRPDHDLTNEEIQVELTAFNPPRDWEIEIVDSGSGADVSLALNKSGQPRMSYVGGIDNSAIQLKYAKYNGSMWEFDPAVDIGPSNIDNSIQIDSKGNPHISYYATFGTALRYIFLENGVWKDTIVDSNSVKGTGIYNSLQLDSQDKPRIAFWDAVKGEIRYASYSGTEWKFSKFIYKMTCTQPFPPIVSLALDSMDDPHISFFECDLGNLMYAHHDNTGWHVETVDYSFRSGMENSIAIDSKDNPHISYRSGQGRAGRLIYTFFNGRKWEFIRVDQDFEYGQYSSLALDEKDRPHIAYTTLPGIDTPVHELRVAFFDGFGWFIEAVDRTVGDADITSVSLQLDKNGHTHVAYIDGGLDQLKYAHRDIYRRYVYMPAIINDN